MKFGVLFKPGSYGHYLAGVVATTLFNNNQYRFNPDSGHGHDIRRTLKKDNNVVVTHWEEDLVDFDKVIVIDYDTDHQLDYVINQHIKQDKYKLEETYSKVFGTSKLLIDVQTGYGMQLETFDEIPTWILRELTSFWIQDYLDSEALKYTRDGLRVPATDIVTNIAGVIQSVAKYLTVPYAEPNLLEHKKFVKAQDAFNIQLRVKDWVDAAINSDKNIPNPCITLLAEAYAQHYLRTNGYELQCDSLNKMPIDSHGLRQIIYKNN